jgi:hypothetical protein
LKNTRIKEQHTFQRKTQLGNEDTARRHVLLLLVWAAAETRAERRAVAAGVKENTQCWSVVVLLLIWAGTVAAGMYIFWC